MTIEDLMEKYSLDWLEVGKSGVYMHMGRTLSFDEWRELNAAIEELRNE